MAIIVTYDVPSKHVELKKALFQKGYTETIKYQNNGVLKDAYLPNTTVYHVNKTANQGLDDVKAICATLNIELERCVSTQYGPDSTMIWGKPFGR